MAAEVVGPPQRMASLILIYPTDWASYGQVGFIVPSANGKRTSIVRRGDAFSQLLCERVMSPAS